MLEIEEKVGELIRYQFLKGSDKLGINFRSRNCKTERS